jgi:hypothetical protein
MIKNIYLGACLIFLVASPVQLFESGLPQPVDALMAFLAAVLLTGFAIKPPVHKNLYLVAALFRKRCFGGTCSRAT